MNIVENGLQQVIINLLKEVEDKHLEIVRLVTWGKISDANIEKLNDEMCEIIARLHPVIDILHTLIPESSSLHKIVDFCQEAYHTIIEPKLKK